MIFQQLVLNNFNDNFFLHFLLNNNNRERKNKRDNKSTIRVLERKLLQNYLKIVV